MARDFLKKLVVGGAIILATAAPLIGKEGKPLKEAEKKPIERHVMLSKSKPFLETEYQLAKSEQAFLIAIEELNRQLEKEGFEKDRILNYYANHWVRPQPDIIRHFTRSPERRAAAQKLTYARYRSLLGLDDKIAAAPGFFEEYQDSLIQASEKHSVPPSIIASIIGVESDFANNKGKYPAFDALASLYTTSKKSFAYNELKELIRYCDRNNRTLDEFTSSYAGAIGWAQFIPSSLNRLFAGKNMDFAADPFDMEDCIHSVAYYLNRSGWDPRREKNVHEGSRNWKALLAYNKSSVYVKAVLELSRSLDNYIRTAAASAKPKPEPDFEF